MGFGTATKKQVTESVTSDRKLNELFTPATELTPEKGLKIAVWGKAKVGKSHFSLTPPTGRIFVIDTESAMKINIQAFPKEIRERIFIIDVLEFSGLKDGTKIDYDMLLAIIDDAVNKVVEAVKGGEKDITVVFDSASDLWDWLGTWLNELPGVSHIGKDQDKVNRLEWGKANKRYEEAMLKLKMSGCNVICTYKAKDAVGPDGADLGFSKPRWQKNSKHIFDVVAMIDKVDGKRVMKFTGGDNGGRYGDKIPELIDPSWEKLVKHLEKHCKIKLSD